MYVCVCKRIPPGLPEERLQLQPCPIFTLGSSVWLPGVPAAPPGRDAASRSAADALSFRACGSESGQQDAEQQDAALQVCATSNMQPLRCGSTYPDLHKSSVADVLTGSKVWRLWVGHL